MVIKRVGPVSCAKIIGLLYAIIGLAIGGILSMVALAGGLAAATDPGASMFFPGLFGMGAIVILPIVYGCLGFVMTLIMAALYNVAAGVVGGVEVDLQ